MDLTVAEQCQICTEVPKLLRIPFIIRDWSIRTCCQQKLCTNCYKKTEKKCPFCRHQTGRNNNIASVEIIRVTIFSVKKN
jgi:hypothetical protein